jgi:hypothetical protein
MELFLQWSAPQQTLKMTTHLLSASVICLLSSYVPAGAKWSICYPVLMHRAMQVPLKTVIREEDICGMLAAAVECTDILTSLSVSQHCCRIVGYAGLHLQHAVEENANEHVSTQDRRHRCREEVITTCSREAGSGQLVQKLTSLYGTCLCLT